MKRAVIAVAGIIIILAFPVGYFVFQPRTSNRISIHGVVLNVNLATTPAEQEKGLSGRDSMAPDHGMLFVFQSENYWSFWMFEMKFPLDMIWFNSSRQAIFFEQNLPPCGPTVCQVFTPPAKAIYVLEVNAGFIAAHQISLGDKFNFVMFALPMTWAPVHRALQSATSDDHGLCFTRTISSSIQVMDTRSLRFIGTTGEPSPDTFKRDWSSGCEIQKR